MDQKHSTLFWINDVIGKLRGYVGILLLIQVILSFCNVLYAMVLRNIINEAVSGHYHEFFDMIYVFIGLIVFQIALKAIDRFLEELSRSTIENRFKERLFSVLLTHSYDSVTKIHSGEWMNRLTSDTVVVAEGVTQILPGIVGMFVKMIGALIAILWLEPRFLYILIPGGILLIVLSYAFRQVLKHLHKNIQEVDGQLRVFLSEHLSSLLIVRVFAREKEIINRANQLMNNHKKARMKRNHFSNICNIGFSLIMNGAYVLGAFFCGYGILTQTMSYGNFIAILQLIGQIQNPFANITGFLPKYYAMIASAERLMEAENFDKDDEILICEKDIQSFYQNEFQCLGMKDVEFTYHSLNRSKESFVLSQMNFEIFKGEYVAFTGTSGCGKSTILKLLMSLYHVNSGECYLIGNEYIALTSSWRGLFAYVPQGNQLLSGTIREIVSFGDMHKMFQDKKIWQALKIACADNFVSQLELGLDTELGERGMGLSEGQMQRIAIARAIYSNRPILLLDEATSSLDEQTEAQLLNNLRLMTDKTIIIVTHRQKALEICDKQIHLS